MTTSPGVTPPDLDNPDLFECRPGVPILDTHTRGDWVVGAERLDLLCRNSNERAARGEYGLMLLGHTTDGGAEQDQPSVVGYMRNYRMGEHAGRPCALADLHYDRADDPAKLMKNYPRRSVEAFYSDTRPEQNYVDSVALLVRPSARDLGFVTYSKRKERVKERYSLDLDPDTGPDPAVASGAFVTRDDLTQAFDQLLAKIQPPAAPPAPNPVAEPAPVAPASTPAPVSPPAPAPPEPPPMPDNTAALSGLNTAIAALQAVATALQPAPAADPDPVDDPATEPVDAVPVDDPAPAKPDDAELERMSLQQAAIRINRYEKKEKANEATTRKLQAEVTILQRGIRRERYEKGLIQLEAEGYDFDRAEELNEVENHDQGGFDRHVEKIRKRYSRSAVGDGLIQTADEVPTTKKAQADDELAPGEVGVLIQYMEEHKIPRDQFALGLQRYTAARQAAR